MNTLPIKSLRDEATDAVRELLSYNIYHRPQYSPGLRQVGMRLDEALKQPVITELRPDVFAFASRMSAMMNAKEDIKGPVDKERRESAMIAFGFSVSAFTQRRLHTMRPGSVTPGTYSYR